MPEPQTQHSSEKVPPHKTLENWYGEDEARHEYVVDLFNRSAKYYDTVERIFFNGGIWYRRFSLKRAGLEPGMKVLDVAIGTAAVAKGAEKIVGPQGRVFGVDPTPGMLAEARKAVTAPLTRGVGQALPFADDTFDFVTMGIALRHVSDLVRAFSEYRRVLKPGGQVWILEAHVPRSRIGFALTKFLWKTVIPGLTYLFTRSKDGKELMDYYWDTIDQCVPPAEILAAMSKAGLQAPQYKLVVPGSFCEYHATK